MLPNIKLQAFLAHAGVASRRKAEELIADKQVTVNGQVATIGQRINPDQDQVQVAGENINQNSETVIYLINKPKGVISTTVDELGRTTVIDFLRREMSKHSTQPIQLPRLYPVGRLDQDSEGLMMLTNDGALSQKMTHPSFETQKTYQITVEGHPTEKALQHLERGVLLKEGLTAPAQVEVLHSDGETTTLTITIHEGRYHQVKRMLLRVGYEVIKLVRIKMGDYHLADLQGKKWLKVTASVNPNSALD